MKLTSQEILRRIGSGEAIEGVRSDAGMTRERFRGWWHAQTGLRLPRVAGVTNASVSSDVEVLRDARGIPHIVASNESDLFFGYGYAMSQDRLWQMDLLRRRATGRMAEVLGEEALEHDVLARTVGFNRIAADHTDRLPTSTRGWLESFSQGVNQAMEECRAVPPIEFSLLDYEPEPWSPYDTVAIWVELRWYLTGRLPVIVLPELARRVLPSERLFEAFLTTEVGDESIVPPGSYPAVRSGTQPVGRAAGGPDDGAGSNNWAVSGTQSASGLPMVASDPHIAFGSTGCWYQVHLHGAGFDAAGGGYVGVPGIFFGRNKSVAWGITNNICSQRDLYQERTDPEHPECYLFDGRWEPARKLTEEIAVKGSAPVSRTIEFSRNGPIVDHLLPEQARDTGPVSLRWLGTDFSDEITSMLVANRAGSSDEFREALREWTVPTLSYVFADVQGDIGYQCVGRIPVREGWDRGYRPGWDPAHQWQGLVPYDAMPALSNPAEGWVRTANNRTAPDDFPYPLSGTWSSGHRAKRIRQMLESGDGLTKDDFARFQSDVLSMRASEAVPPLILVLDEYGEGRVRHAADLLRSWDFRMDSGSAAAAVFELFFAHWSRSIAAERFDGNLAPLMAGGIGGLAVQLLSRDEHGWFHRRDRESVIADAMGKALDELEERIGPDIDSWTWGAIHTIELRHHLDDRGGLSELLSRGGHPVSGSGVTVCNTGYDPNYMSVMGANYRLVVDLSDGTDGLWTVDAAGQSGHPGSANYCDQLPTWLAGEHHHIPLDIAAARDSAVNRLTLRPE